MIYLILTLNLISLYFLFCLLFAKGKQEIERDDTENFY